MNPEIEKQAAKYKLAITQSITFNESYYEFVRGYLLRLWREKSSNKLTLEQLRCIAMGLPGVFAEKAISGLAGKEGHCLDVQVFSRNMKKRKGHFWLGFEEYKPFEAKA